MANDDKISVNLIVASPNEQRIIALELPLGSCVQDAIKEAQLTKVSAENVGVFGRRCTMTQLLSAGDQVEVYRALLDDPKSIRRRRAQANREAS